jgi:hypothetical protein
MITVLIRAGSMEAFSLVYSRENRAGFRFGTPMMTM